jgi:hypothetical protein
MNTTNLITAPEAPDRPSFGDLLTEILPWVAAVVVLGPLTLLTLMLWAPFLLLFSLVAAPAAAASLIGVAGAILATPYLLVRHVHRRLTERRKSTAGSVAIPRFPALAERTTAGGAQ